MLNILTPNHPGLHSNQRSSEQTSRQRHRITLCRHGADLGLHDCRPSITMVCMCFKCHVGTLSFIYSTRIGPEKGVIHIATGAVNNALWDMYARSRKKPLWKLVVDFTPVRVCLVSPSGAYGVEHFVLFLVYRKNLCVRLRFGIFRML